MRIAQRYSLEALANVVCQTDPAGVLHGSPTSGDPQLAVRLSDGPLQPGYWCLRLKLKGTPGAAAKIYPDYGGGFAEATARVLSSSRASNVQYVILHFPAQVVALRIDPCEDSHNFSVEPVTLEKVAPRRALWLRARELLSAAPFKDAVRLVDRIEQLTHLARTTDVETAWEALETSLHQGWSQSTAAPSYQDWILQNDPLHTLERRIVGAEQTDEIGDLISILMPTYNSDTRWLKKAVESVLAQSYPHWELCIADDASTSEDTLRCLRELASKEPRIRVEFRQINGHISHATNSALEMVRGQYFALMDHDDELHPYALQYVHEALLEHPDATLVYSDEDKIDQDQNRFDPYFKPDWNPDLLLGQNFISHLGVYRSDLVKGLGGLRPGFEGSQDHDLALRVAAASRADQIIHIPRVLYHWRAIAGSTALSGGEKGYAAEAALRAVQDHLDSAGEKAQATLLEGGGIRVRWELPQPRPFVSIIIPTRDKVDLLRQCVSSILRATTYESYEILVVDNGSVEPQTLEYLEDLRVRGVKVLEWSSPFNYSEINNFAAGQASGDLLAFVNNDIEVIDPEWLEEMVSHAVKPGVGAVGAKLFYPDGSIQHAGVVLGVHGVAAHAYCGRPGDYPGQMNRANLLQSYSAVTAACLVLRRAVFEQVGGFDTGLAVAFNDIDLCLRIRQSGLRNVWTPFARLYHHESASRGREDTEEKQTRFREEVEVMRARWGELLDNDPSYNPNLTRRGEPFALGQ